MSNNDRHSGRHSPFRVNTGRRSYLFPAVKIAIAIALIAASISWTSIWRPDDRRLEAVISVAGLFVSFICAYIICVAVGEMGFVAENREREKVLMRDPADLKTKKHSVTEILERFEESRDTELLAVLNGKLAYIGVRTSYSKAAGYHNKRYYINDDEYSDPDHFADVLTELTHSAREICVASIDGKAE